MKNIFFYLALLLLKHILEKIIVENDQHLHLKLAIFSKKKKKMLHKAFSTNI